LPLDLLTNPDPYFAGAYRCLEQLLPVAGERIKTHQKEGEIALEVMSTYCRTSYGQVLDVLRATGLSASAVMEQVSRPGVPRRLEKAALAGFIGAPPAPH